MSLLSLLYPKRCKRCGASLREHQHILCDQCLEDGEYYFYQSFSVPGVDEADAPLVYKDFVREAMHAYKFQYRRAYADWFARMVSDCLDGYLDGWKPDCITFVPVSFFRWMRRGYNQSALVARLVAQSFGLPCVRTLRKCKRTRVQSSLPHEKRMENVRGAFAIRDAAAVAGRRVLLIDDVVTTGATAAACAEALREAGAEAIFLVSMTKTPPVRRK